MRGLVSIAQPLHGQIKTIRNRATSNKDMRLRGPSHVVLKVGYSKFSKMRAMSLTLEPVHDLLKTNTSSPHLKQKLSWQIVNIFTLTVLVVQHPFPHHLIIFGLSTVIIYTIETTTIKILKSKLTTEIRTLWKYGTKDNSGLLSNLNMFNNMLNLSLVRSTEYLLAHAQV